MQTWYLAQTNVEADQLNRRFENCLRRTRKITHAAHVARLPRWICNAGHFYRSVQSTGRSRCKYGNLAHALWLTKGRRWLPGQFGASLFSTFERQALVGTGLWWLLCVLRIVALQKFIIPKSFLVCCLRKAFLYFCHLILFNQVYPSCCSVVAWSARPDHCRYPIIQQTPTCFVCIFFY